MISIIIPTRNRAEMLDSALASLTRQTLPAKYFEVLIVDNGSSDHTFAVAEEYSDKLNNLRYVFESELGLHAGRHRGMIEAKGDILVYCDDDIEALPSWLESIQDAFTDPNTVMVGGNNLPLFVGTPPVWLTRLWEQSKIRMGLALPALSILELTGTIRSFSPYYVWGCNFSIRKNVLVAAGGFNPDGMPKDLIRFRGDGETHVSRFVQESGMKCVFHPGASVHHKVTPERMTFSYFYQRGFNQGVSDSYTTLRNNIVMPSTKIHLLRRIGSWGWSKFRSLMITDPEVKRALRELKAGHREGYAYHQQAYCEDPEVRDWVHQPTYIKEHYRSD